MADGPLNLVTPDLLAQIQQLVRWQASFSISGDGVSTNRTPDGFSARIAQRAPIAARTPAGSLVRMKVTDPAPSGSTGVVLAKVWDGTTTSGDDIAVLGVQGHSLDDDIAAVQVVGGVPGDPVSSGDPVLWVEYLILPVSTSRYQVVQVIDTAGKLGVDSVRVE